ncbi:ABC transporter substrate-binding protein [Pseudoalteromonas ruthenica]|uniref:Signal peptide prediction n=1 Tax=Pseudoalteromonas ruthenica TaxID=151081 RepID=A0A0F4PIJ2_9GAMM|nr:extracellular solute-binding protein [Pseudoalteromonas ruthenica]KJY94949.1 signal peptide prediction [Pseudoalteromonas ruthenica]KJZ00193.1 signal peptide prediction [Pseudoalteromonas ruthenica]TMO88078.1 signal peptide prediction [Pseudoalteromonas ruthenica]TMO92338.1 signal peptide prediction [Pseudoalteromonas ruthenica]TMO96134.1 signal peptide prediction [Pseudoalteromonas ruthenica]
MSYSPTRRQFLRTLGQGAAVSTLALKAPYVFAKKKVTLRVMGTHVTLQEELRQRAMRELGIHLVFSPMGSAALLQKAAADPSSFDVYEQWSDSINILWQAGAIQPIDVDRLTYWDEINNLTKTGQLTESARVGAGDAPNKILYVQDDGQLGPQATDKVSFMPYVHNVDSFGYNTQHIAKGRAYETESWSWLLDEQNKGKVALVNAPTIGIFDAALAVQGQGLMTFKDMGNMSIAEIDKLFSILLAKKRQGHFSGFWTSVPQSVDFMKTNRVHIQSMFSPGVSACRGQGIPVVYAAPKEGYRAWHGVMCLSAHTSGAVKDAAYEYMNWWLSGYPGAFIARQGYYISNPQRSQPLMSKAEWQYWYEGHEASMDLRGTDGKVSVQAGQIRNGGSYTTRFSNVAVWNTVMPNYDYSLDKWYELLNA